ncbi:MAG: ATP-dependent zinc protease [Deltaproteobacteria bacterium]|nr:ATP-dependent zinc protease [Deltaproteobacteria bacterium]
MRYINRCSLLGVLLTSLLIALSLPAGAEGARRKKIVGATEQVRVEEADLEFRARIDSGAEGSSIHTQSVEVEGRSKEMARNVGKEVTFRVKNEKGKVTELRRTIQDVVRVKNAEGGERRYQVYLTILHGKSRKRVLVYLDDREDMPEKLLLGRNWLGSDFLIDVGR